MSGLGIISWFICGILGVYIGNAVDRFKNIPNAPVSVLFAILGPGVLFGVLVQTVVDAINGRPND